MLQRPSSCVGCSLNIPSSTGFMKAEGFPELGVTLMGEALGESEAERGLPFQGAAGIRLGKMIEGAGYKREQFLITNAVWCRPYNNSEPPTAAIEHCKRHWEPILDPKQTRVLVPMGNVPLFSTTGGEGILSRRGYVEWSEKYQCYILPTVHPSFIMRGNSNWEAAFLYDLRHAVEVAKDGWTSIDSQRDYTLDAGIRATRDWVDDFKRNLRINPLNPVAADLETPDKSAAEDETDINLGYLPGPIHRCGFAYVNRAGRTKVVSMPWDVNHLPFIREVLETGAPKIFCPTPDQKVLTANLRWVSAGELKVGDELVSFDEHPQGQKTRNFKTGTVTFAEPAQTETFAVTFEDGTVVKVSGEHQWLARKRGKHTANWIKTTQLQPGYLVARFTEPWQEDFSKEAGYLAGFFDGEGSVSKQVKGSLSINASQNEGPTRRLVIELLRGKGFVVSDYGHPTRSAKGFGLRGPLGEKLRFLGSIRPRRLLAKAVPSFLGSTQVHTPKLKIVSIKSLGVQTVIQLSVDARTYVLEGFPAHNCYRHFDVPRIKAHQVLINGAIHDIQEAWHCLHSDLPKSLEHITPYLCPNQPAWKHLNHGSTQAYYNGVDCAVTVEGWLRVKALLQSAGMWDLYWRDIHKLNEILIYMSDQGMPIDPVKRMEASVKLGELKETCRVKMNEAASKARPSKVYSQARFSEGLQEIEVEKEENFCSECQKRVPGQGSKHPHFRCGVAEGEVPLGALGKRVVKVRAWIKPLDFKPSQKGMKRYVEYKGYKLITRWDRDSGTRKASMDENNIRKYALRHVEDPLFPLVLEYRELDKLLGTYVGRLTDEPEKVKTGQDLWWEQFRALPYKTPA